MDNDTEIFDIEIYFDTDNFFRVIDQEVGFDVYIFDSGINYYSHFRKASRPPIILISGSASRLHMAESVIDGFSDSYILRPFSENIVHAKIIAFFRSFSFYGRADYNVQIGDYIYIRNEGQIVDSNGVRFRLGGISNRLLDYFLTNPGVVFEKNKIYRHLTGLDRLRYSDSYVDVQINRLRRAFGSTDDGKGVVMNVRGKGYKITPNIKYIE